MAYTPYHNPWNDGAAGGTPITAAALNHIEQGIVAASANTSNVASAIYAPIGTNNAATDTPNLQSAITSAQAIGADLIIPSGQIYQINTGLTWDLSHGSIRTTGPVDINCAPMTSGVALTITGGAAVGPSNYFVHRAATNSISGIRLTGPNADASTVDGILFSGNVAGLDQGALRQMIITGFRDGLTYGSNVWNIDHQRVSISNAHRYGINFTNGSGSGEGMTFTDCSIFNCHNASNTAVGLYFPSATNNTDVRFFGGILDYNDITGVVQGGNISFIGTHIEDNATGPMFQYSSVTGGADTNVMFRDCTWVIASTSARAAVHQVVTSTKFRVTVRFDGGSGTVSQAAATQWFLDSSGDNSLGIQVNYRNFNVVGLTGNNILLMGDSSNQLYNGYFEDSTAFVTGGVLGWTKGATSTWTIGTGGRVNNALKAVSSAATDFTYQQIAVNSSEPLRITGYISTPTFTSGTMGIFIQFYAVDRTTPVAGPITIGTLTALQTGWVGASRIIRVPRGAFFMTVQLTTTAFTGTAMWDHVEVTRS
jgi:hypothetical protein